VHVLITGSRGFAGRALAAHLRGLGHQVTGLTRSLPGAGEVAGDMLDPASLALALERTQPAVVVNLAARTDLQDGAAADYAVNDEGVRNLMTACASARSVRRVIWGSSQLAHRIGETPEPSDALDPQTPYGRSKAEGERIVRSGDGGGKEWVVTRSTTIWGPGQSAHYTRVLRLIESGRYFHIGRSPLKKSYSYVENCAAQIASLVLADAAMVHRGTFYLCDSEDIDLVAFYDAFAAHMGRRIPVMPRSIARTLARVGDAGAALGLALPLTRARLANILTPYRYDQRPIEAVHGTTAISMEEGIERTWRWYDAQGRAAL
jgi:nucleoside-diphosphate-sugar epimerase